MSISSRRLSGIEIRSLILSIIGEISNNLTFNCRYSIECGINDLFKRFLDPEFEFREDMITVNHYENILEADQSMKEIGYSAVDMNIRLMRNTAVSPPSG